MKTLPQYKAIDITEAGENVLLDIFEQTTALGFPVILGHTYIPQFTHLQIQVDDGDVVADESSLQQIVLTGGKRVNKEKFYARLLGTLIDNGLGQFSFTKHESGDDTNTSCWFNDCCDLQIDSGCQNMCGIPVDMTIASERLLFLFENSLLENREFGLRLIEKANRGAI